MKGRVIKATGTFFKVQDEKGREYECRLKGNWRLRDYKFTNPVVVGDNVQFSEGREGNFMIEDIDTRKNYIVRRAVNLSKQMHIIASNIDQAVLIVTLSHPKTYVEFIDRFLVTSGAYHIPAVLIFNKTDLCDAELKNEMDQLIELYSALGYPCLKTSVHDDESLEKIKLVFKGKITLISGYSGVGKSTILNRLDPTLKIKTSQVSDIFDAGKHTTSFAEMHEIKGLGRVIDTPGIKGLGIIEIPKEEISHYFPEMLELISACKFHNCSHIDEPSCAVKKAAEESKIAVSRYKSYLSIYNEEKEKYR